MQERTQIGVLPTWQVVAIMAVTVIARVLGSVVFPVYDDAFITYRYARNLVRLGAFVYNPHEFVMGTTSPLFGLFVSVLMLLGVPIPTGVIICNVLIDLAIIWLVLRYFLAGVGGRVALFAAICYAASPLLVRISVGGMEANLFLLGILAAIALHRSGRDMTAVILASALSFVRPESALLVAFLLAKELQVKRVRRALLLSVVSIAVVTPVLYLLYHTYGSFVPQSVAEKSSVHTSVFEVLHQLLAPNVASIALVILSVLGLYRSMRANEQLRSFLQFTGLYVAAYLIMRPSVWSWYAMPVQAGIAFGAGFGLDQLCGALPAGILKVTDRLVGVGLPVAVILLWAGIYVQSRAVSVTRGIYDEVERWSATAKPEHEIILATDIGVIGYYSNARIFDAGGLITPLDPSLRRNLEGLVDTSHADYLFLNTNESVRPFLETDRYRRRYRLVRRFGARDTSTSGLVLPKEWVQDYLLFERTAGY